MFHPIYNNDGRVSVFRLLCLVVIALCMGIYGFLLLNKESANSASLSDVKDNKSETLAKDNSDNNLDSALKEFASSASFLSSCGILNQGFEGCDITFSNKVLATFNTRQDIADDGYVLEISAKKPQHCAVFKAVNDEFFAFDDQGKAADDCLNLLKAQKANLISHDYERLQGQPAPSGFVPLFTQTAENRNLQRQVSSVNKETL